MAPSSSSALLIKGYLPVRLLLPPTWSQEYHDETYFYIREHQAGKSKLEADDDNETSNQSKSKSKSTIFVANAPVVPGVSTKILLHSLFGRFANVTRVTVINNPRKDQDSSEATITTTPSSSLKWSTKFDDPTFLPPIYSEGKFAHVVMETPKDMKKAIRAMQDAMKSTKEDHSDTHRPGLVLEKIEIQTLSDETSRIYRQERRKILGLGQDDDDDNDSGVEDLQGIHAVAARYRARCAELSREKLLEECNAVMQAYEDAEEAKKRALETAKSQPDEDGFVTVSYSAATGSQVELEQNKHVTGGTSATRRKGGNMRSRKKKEAVGAKELPDFYRFQRKEHKKRTLEDLRAQFEEDLQRVKRMKEERHYKPF